MEQKCLHFGNKEIMSLIIKDRVGESGEWRDFGEALDAATKERMMIDTNNLNLSGYIWMVPFTQYKADSGTQNYIGLLDCSRYTIEFTAGD